MTFYLLVSKNVIFKILHNILIEHSSRTLFLIDLNDEFGLHKHNSYWDKNKKEEKIMPRPFCTDVETKSGKATLKKLVEQIIKKNQKVFDNLAKS
jgi:hypothetical protein